MDLKTRLLNAVTLKQVDRKPVACVTQTGTIEFMKASNSYWPYAHRDPDKMAKLAIAAHSIGGFENVRIPFGIHAEAEALGCKVNYYEGTYDRTPVTEPPLDNNALVRDADPSRSKTTKTVVDAVKILNKNYPDIPVVVGVLAPFSITGHIHTVAKLMKQLIKAPDEVMKTLDFTSDFVVAYIKELEMVGADLITLIEPIATGENIGPVLFEKFVLPYIKKVVESAKVPTMLHICGDSTCIIPLMVRTGTKGISIDHKVSVQKAKELTMCKASVVGNINPVDILMKKPNDLVSETIQVIKGGTDVVAPGCGLAPRTPTNNIRIVTQTVKTYSQ